MLIAGLAGLSLVGCRDNDFDWDAAYGTKLDYIFAKEFQKQFGEIDPTHDWSTGTVITADVDLSAWTSGSAVLRVMTCMPIHDDCVMLYNGTVSGASTIYFDAPRHLTHVYVTAEQDGKYVLGQYFEIEDETCSIKASETRARTNDVCYTKKNDNKKVDLTKDGIPSTKYYLTNVQSSKTDATKLTIRDLVKYVGNGNAYFPEGYWNINPEDTNREKFDEIFSRDVIYTVAEEGPVWVDCFFGATAYYNQFGYYYYTEGDTEVKTRNNKRKANKYVLIDDARPDVVIEVSPNRTEGRQWPGMFLSDVYIKGYQNSRNGVTGDEVLTGTKYRLVYFDENNKASFNFPKGTKIGFFIHKIYEVQGGGAHVWTANETSLHNDEKDTERIRYSDSDLNAFYYPDLKYKGEPYWAAVSCRIGDKIVCGFEDNIDGGDSDMNDILFFIEGVDPSDIPDIPVPEPNLSECIIAYEDLGTTDDFDFNDVVISVSARRDGYSFIKLLAAGGTLDTKVIYKGKDGDIELNFYDPNSTPVESTSTNGTEVHDAFGVSQTTMVKTGRANPNVSYDPTARINVPEGWTVGANKQRFAIKVQQAKGEVKIVNIPYTEGEAPQAFLIADPNWKWPTERQNIKDKYPGFQEWVNNNLKNNTWYSATWPKQSSNNQ